MARILVTGTAGFIGFHVAARLLADGHLVSGIDGMTSYYNVELKRQRHSVLSRAPGFTLNEVLLEDSAALTKIWQGTNPEIVIHLAAQAGVRYSIDNPRAYLDANIIGTFNILELARNMPPQHLLVASTSSVYGANQKIPFKEIDQTDHPVSLYAATKKATEVIGHSYAHLFRIPITFLRFFTVYGPWGRPDMAYSKFARAILRDEPIEVYNNGDMARDFTYVSDIVEGIVRLMNVVPTAVPNEGIRGDTLSPLGPYRVVNLGAGRPMQLVELIESIERNLGLKSRRIYLPMQQGDVPTTFADVDLLEQLTGFRPSVQLEEGINQFVTWYRNFYRFGP